MLTRNFFDKVDVSPALILVKEQQRAIGRGCGRARPNHIFRGDRK